MKLGFLKYHIENSFIDDKDSIIDALDKHNWLITNYNVDRHVVELKSNKGYWLTNIDIDLFPKEILVTEILNLYTQLI